MAKYNVFLPLADSSELSARVVTVNGEKYAVDPSAPFYRTKDIAPNTPVSISYHNVYLDNTTSGESEALEFIAGQELPFSTNSFFAKLYGSDSPVDEGVPVIIIPPPAPEPPVVNEEPVNVVVPPEVPVTG